MRPIAALVHVEDPLAALSWYEGAFLGSVVTSSSMPRYRLLKRKKTRKKERKTPKERYS